MDNKSVDGVIIFSWESGEREGGGKDKVCRVQFRIFTELNIKLSYINISNGGLVLKDIFLGSGYQRFDRVVYADGQ